MENKKTYKKFCEALDTLRVDKDLSYDRLALFIKFPSSYTYSIINRRHSAPKNRIIEQIAKSFNIEPEYFLEYRIRKLVTKIEEEPKILDKIEDFLNKPKNN